MPSPGSGRVLAASPPLAAIEISDEMRSLPVGGRQLAWGHEALTQQRLFVFPVKDNDLHDQILVLAKQAGHLRLLGAFVRTELLPGCAVLADLIKRLVETGKQVFFGLIGLK